MPRDATLGQEPPRKDAADYLAESMVKIAGSREGALYLACATILELHRVASVGMTRSGVARRKWKQKPVPPALDDSDTPGVPGVS